MSLGFFFNNTRCTGCRTCELACIDYKDLPVSRRFRRVIDVEGGSTTEQGGVVTSDAFAYHVSLACNHCADPACMHVCPTGAMHRNDLGLVCVDTKRCIGCGYCTIACPYHAPSIDPVLMRSSKCDGCSERVERGLAPLCVEACPLRALEFGEVGELTRRHPGCSRVIFPLPDSTYTNPNLLVALSPAAMRAQEQGGVISNAAEITNNSNG